MVGDKVLWSPECQWLPPPPLKKNSPFAAQLKIAFRRFLFCDEILLAGTAVPFMNKEFTGKSLLTLFSSVLVKAVKKFF